MARAVTLSRIDETLETLEYPVSREDAAGTLADVTLLLADGERNLGDVVDDCSGDSFDSQADLELEIYEYLPVEALGEPAKAEADD
jgi:hypothetical protein